MPDLSSVRRQLAAELRRLRAMNGRSGRDMGGISQAKVSRIERGEALPTRTEVQQWAELTVALPDEAERVLALVEAAHRETRPWSELFAEHEQHLQATARRRELASARIRNFQPVIVPGLLQTADYARAVLGLGHTVDVAAAVASRLERQQLLHEPGRRLEFIVAERALTWSPGEDALIGQLERLVSLAGLDVVTLAVLPAGAAQVVPWHGFIIRDPLDQTEDPSVSIEMFHGQQQLSDPGDLAVYEGVWRVLWDSATHGVEAVELIRAAKG